MSYALNASPTRSHPGLTCFLTIAIGIFLASDATAAQFTLSWSDNSTNETGFRIERSTGGTAFTEIAMAGANVVSYVDAGLPNATSYSYRLRAYNSAGNSGYSNVAMGTTPPPASNSAPTISDIANQSVNVGSSTGAVAVTIGDVETAAGSLALSASSSNTTLVPAADIVLGGSGSSRTVTVTPASSQTGTATITITVSDGSLTASDSFVLSVRAANDAPPPGNSGTATNSAPTITSIPTQNIALNGTTRARAFTVRDAETAATGLTLSSSSSNPGLVPLGNITFSGSGARRTVTVRPLSNTTGSSTITLTVSDGTLTKTTSFVVNVAAKLTYGNVGAPSIAGSQRISGSTITIRAGGTDIGGSSDQFRFGRVQLAGDTELTVRVASLTKSDAWAKAGLMFRASTNANAAYVFVCITPSNGVALQYRASSSANAVQKYNEAAVAPRWLKLTRSGDTFYAFHSSDGATWDLVDFVTVELPDVVPAGLAVTSHHAKTATTATFDGLRID